MIGAPFLVLGVLLLLGAFLGPRVRERERGWIGAFVLSPLHPATWYATFAIVAGFFVGVVAFSLVASLLSAGTSLLVVGIGVVVIGLAVEACRVIARIERRRATLADPRPLHAHAYRPYGSGLQDLALAVFTDVSRWRDVVYVFVSLPLTIMELVVVVVLWAASIAFLSVPLWHATGALPGAGSVPASAALLSGLAQAPGVVALASLVVGLVLLPVAASVSQGLMALHRAVVAGLLCESEQRALQRRVETLEGSRRAVIDVEAGELRRIERDLHDGAQQRLVGLTIDLSLAAEKIETDPAGARELVVDAREQARLALAELRDLVRGIAPAILLDRGLVPALSALAGRCPVPTTVVSTLPEGVRLPDSVERAAYFVVAEALANVAKHASATCCEVRCRVEAPAGSGAAGGSRLVVEAWDDGAGGARIVPGGGLAGLAGRVEALDGTLSVKSPEGGPTLVRAEIPLAAVPVAAVPAPGALWVPQEPR